MKIGLITFHNSHNCGSMLQAYALQTAIKDNNKEVEILDFSNEGQKRLYNVYYENTSIKNIIKNIIIFPKIQRIKRDYEEYEKFKVQNFNLSKKKYAELKDFKENELDYEQYICGSDQIWNITLEDSDDAYFLPFVKKHKKIAYAPSFGAKNIEKYVSTKEKLEYYKEKINEFSYLSTRENNGKIWMENLTNRKDIQVLLDPTLIIDKSNYDKLEESIKTPEHFIFYYAPGYIKGLNKFVKKLSNKYKLPVIVFNSKQYYVKRLWKNGFKLPEKESPAVYLYLIKNADMVLTTSFHGTIFSSIYRKKFWILKNGGMYGDDDRVKTLINELKLEERLIEPVFDTSFDYAKDVDYNEYDEQLNKMKIKSSEYLRKAIND